MATKRDGFGVEFDLVHTTVGRLESCIDRISAGLDWQTGAWPDPLYVVSGVAYGRPLVDETA